MSRASTTQEEKRGGCGHVAAMAADMRQCPATDKGYRVGT